MRTQTYGEAFQPDGTALQGRSTRPKPQATVMGGRKEHPQDSPDSGRQPALFALRAGRASQQSMDENAQAR